MDGMRRKADEARRLCGTVRLALPPVHIASAISADRLQALIGSMLDEERHRAAATTDGGGGVTAPPVVVIGFDTERTYGARPRLALVQLATASRVLLITVPSWSPAVPALARLFADETVIKAGYCVADDIDALRAVGVERTSSVVDLCVTPPFGTDTLALTIVVARLLHIDMTSDYEALPRAHPRFSQWGKRWLCPCQIVYAARDAYACRLLYAVRHRIGELYSCRDDDDSATSPSKCLGFIAAAAACRA